MFANHSTISILFVTNPELELHFLQKPQVQTTRMILLANKLTRIFVNIPQEHLQHNLSQNPFATSIFATQSTSTFVTNSPYNCICNNRK